MNDFDPASFQLSPEQLAAVQQRQLERELGESKCMKGKQSRMRKVRDKRLPGIDTAFVMVPWPYVLEVGTVLNSGAAVLMLLALLYEEWRRETSKNYPKPDTIELPNEELEKAGIHRTARTRGLKRLVAAGIIEIAECKPGRPLQIKLLWPGKRKPHPTTA